MIGEGRQHDQEHSKLYTCTLFITANSSKMWRAGFATHAGRIKKSSGNRTYKNTPWRGSNNKRKEVKRCFFYQFWSFYKIPSRTMKVQQQQRINVRDTPGWMVQAHTRNSDNYELTKTYSNLSTEYLLDTTTLTRKSKKATSYFHESPLESQCWYTEYKYNFI